MAVVAILVHLSPGLVVEEAQVAQVMLDLFAARQVLLLLVVKVATDTFGLLLAMFTVVAVAVCDQVVHNLAEQVAVALLILQEQMVLAVEQVLAQLVAVPE
jgi:hypothetical protein